MKARNERIESRSSRLLTNTGIFAVGTVLTQLVALVTVPLVTARLSTAEYGSVDLLITIASMLLPVASLSIGEAVVRFGMDDSFSKRKVVSAAYAIGAAGFVTCLSLWPLGAGIDGLRDILGFGYAILFAQILRDIAAGYLRATGRIKTLVAGGVTQSLLLAAGIVLLVGYAPGGRGGYLVALLASNLVIGVVFTLVTLWGVRGPGPSNPNGVSAQMLRFSTPLVPNALLWLVVASSSRFFLFGAHGEAAVGVYAVAVRVTTVIVGMTSVFMQAWQLSAIEERDAIDRRQFEGGVFTALAGVLVLGSSCVLLLLKPAMRFFFVESYFEAWMSVPPLLFGVIWLTFASFTGTQYKVMMTTSRALWTSLAGAASVVALSALLVPQWGGFGAGLATCGGYAALWLLRLFDIGLPYLSKGAATCILLSLLALACQASLLYLDVSDATSLLSGIGIFALLVALNRHPLLRVAGMLFRAPRVR